MACASCGSLVGAELARYRGGPGRRHSGRGGSQLPQVTGPGDRQPPLAAEGGFGRASRRAGASSAAPGWRRWRSPACHRPDPDGDWL